MRTRSGFMPCSCGDVLLLDGRPISFFAGRHAEMRRSCPSHTHGWLHASESREANMTWNRRRFLEMTIGAAALPLAGCSQHASLKLCPVEPKDFETLNLCDFTVLRIGPEAGRRILLLHEITGLTKDDL